MKYIERALITFLLLLIATFAIIFFTERNDFKEMTSSTTEEFKKLGESLEHADNSKYVVVDNKYEILNNNWPSFTEEEINKAKNTQNLKEYSKLDGFDRCGVAYMKVTPDTLTFTDRDNMSSIKPTGWHTYNTKENWDITLPDDSFYLYNRGHLLAYCLSGDLIVNSGIPNKSLNLITMTRQCNLLMSELAEKPITKYVNSTGKSVLYKCTPIFEGQELVARYVIVEAKSLSDNDLTINLKIYNAQEGFEINYLTGEANILQ